MAHFAQLDENNKVIQVIVVHNNELLDAEGKESEQKGISFCQNLFGENTKWLQTSYNGTFRKSFAAVGGVYDDLLNIFIPPRPYASWKFDYENHIWQPPIPEPEAVEGYVWLWSEINKEWVKIQLPDTK